MQSIKQKMWVQLAAQGLDLCLAQAGFKFQRFDLSVAQVVRIAYRVPNASDDPKHERVRSAPLQYGSANLRKEVSGLVRPGRNPRFDPVLSEAKRVFEQRMEQRNTNRADQQAGNIPRPDPLPLVEA